ncbi:hypothetical protein DNK31_18245 [Phytopseudomonas daroniae]|nr:hypothetical protein DNK31_18245 [Pseudomonas sp. FRB 228]
MRRRVLLGRSLGDTALTGPHDNNQKVTAMFKKPKFRQAGLILFATAVLLILPNLSRMIG